MTARMIQTVSAPTSSSITCTPATVSLSAIKTDYRRFIYYHEAEDGIFVPCWSWNEENYYTRPDGCKCTLGDGLLDLVEKALNRHFSECWDAAAKAFFTCAPAQVRDYVDSLERYGTAYLSNYLDGSDKFLGLDGEPLDNLPDRVLRWIVAACKAVIELRDAADAFAVWEEYSHVLVNKGPGYEAHNYDWEYEASDEMLVIVRSACEEILASREKERKRKEREKRAARPLTSRPFAAVLAHLAA